MVENLMTIKAFAEAVGVSQQSIYKRLNKLNNPLEKYVKEINGKKYIDSRAVSQIYNITEPKERTIKPDTTKEKDNTERLIVLLESQIVEKDKQILEKDKQIENLIKRLDEAHQLVNQQQQLLAIEKKEFFEFESQKEEDVCAAAGEKENSNTLNPEPAEEMETKNSLLKIIKKFFFKVKSM